MYDDGDGASSPPPQQLKRPVRIVVHDKAKHESRTFSCDAMLLRSSMSYFAAVLDQLLDVADRSANTPLSLNVNCDIPIFSWLIEFIHNRHPPMLPSNVVSLILSSNFLMMHKLYHEGLRYLKEHLVEVLLTDVNMDCISLDTTLGLAQLLREDDIAQALLALVDEGNERCANRSFLSLLLKHVVQHRICDDPVSLRWCDHCGLLVDVEMLKAVNSAVTQELPCQMLGAGRVGSRGEVLKTHEATAAVADNFMASLLSNANNATGILVQGGGVGTSTSATASSSAASSFAQVTGGDSAEAVCWRLIGSCRIYRCDRCDAAVQLINIRQHNCGAGGVSGTSPAAQPFSLSWQQCLPSARQSQEEHLLNLFATVLPSMPPIRRTLPNPNATALSAVASQQTAAVASPYACPFLGDDPSATGMMMPNQSTSAAQGPILWKRGATHTAQAMQSDGTPNMEMIRFHETRMMLELRSFVNSFGAASPPAAATTTARSQTSSGRGGGLGNASQRSSFSRGGGGAGSGGIRLSSAAGGSASGGGGVVPRSGSMRGMQGGGAGGRRQSGTTK